MHEVKNTAGVAVRRIVRAEPAALPPLATAGSCTVYDAQGRTGVMEPLLRPVYAGAAVAGSAVTVLCPVNDNWMMHVAMELCLPGDVLVVATQAGSADAVCGGLLAKAAVQRGVCGLVTDGAVRDVREFARLRFPAWSRGVCARGSLKNAVGSVNVPVVCAGQAVNPGDVVVADDDGVAVVPRQQVGEVVQAVAERQRAEEAVSRRLEAGELGLDIYQMRGRLAEAGLRYADRAEDADRQD